MRFAWGKSNSSALTLASSLLTASGDATTVAMALELDVSGYIVKPATPEKLRTVIAKARTPGDPASIFRNIRSSPYLASAALRAYAPRT